MNNRLQAKTRLQRFDIAKGICIILVALGHFNPYFSPEWYKNFVYGFCAFHMPTFMFASGYIYLAYKKNISYYEFIRKKAYRLMLPYFMVSTAIILIKIVAQNNGLYIQHPVTFNSFLKILYSPDAAYFLWFAWALFVIFLIVPFFKTPFSRLLLFIFAVFLHYTPIPDLPDIFCVNEVRVQLIWFVLGMICVDYDKIKWCNIIQNKLFKMFVFIAFIICYSFVIMIGHERINWSYIILSWTGLYVVMQLSILIEQSKDTRIKNIFLSVGMASYVVYLLHTSFEGLVKSISTRFSLMQDTNNVIFISEAVIVCMIGVCTPVIIYKYIIVKYKITRFLFGL